MRDSDPASLSLRPYPGMTTTNKRHSDEMAAIDMPLLDEFEVLPRLLTPEQAGEILGISHRLLYVWKAEGNGPTYVKIGHALRYKMSDLVNFIEFNSHDPKDA